MTESFLNRSLSVFHVRVWMEAVITAPAARVMCASSLVPCVCASPCGAAWDSKISTDLSKRTSQHCVYHIIFLPGPTVDVDTVPCVLEGGAFEDAQVLENSLGMVSTSPSSLQTPSAQCSRRCSRLCSAWRARECPRKGTSSYKSRYARGLQRQWERCEGASRGQAE